MTGADQILTTLRGLAPELGDRFGVSALAIFGSSARGDEHAGSDVDVLVSFRAGQPVTLFTLAQLKLRLEETLRRSVDLVEDHPRLRPSFRAAIEKDLIRVA